LQITQLPATKTIAHQAGDLAQAERMCNQVLLENPEQAESHYFLGTIFIAKGKYDDAAKVLQRSLNVRPNSPEVLNNLGVVLARQKGFAEAIELLRQALKFRPEWGELYRNQGNSRLTVRIARTDA
jgi:protein O-GlcNAc transferase